MPYLEGLTHQVGQEPCMHKHTKLTLNTRREVYDTWIHSNRTVTDLARSYHVDRNIIYRVIARGRLGDFSVHDSTNHRFRTIEFGLKRLLRKEVQVQKRLDRGVRKHPRYEKNVPGEMVHGDTKRLPPLKGLPVRYMRREVLFVAIDDCSRFLMADILPDKTMWSSALFLENASLRLPFSIYCYYTDNGGEYRGAQDHAVPAFCMRSGIVQRFTKPYHPWTNGKAERVIKTLLYEWLKDNAFPSYEERRASLYRFVEYYNHERSHMGIHDVTPFQKLSLYTQGCDNA